MDVTILNGLASLIYVDAMKMDSFYLGIAMAIPALIGASFSPFLGYFSDNFRSRWGRRKLFILVGAIGGAVVLPLLWMVPKSAVGIQIFAYVTFMITLQAIFYTIFSIPYGAMGLELTTDSNERTRVLAWKGYVVTLGTLLASWFYWFCNRPIFLDVIQGAQCLSLIGSLIMVLGALAVCFYCKEVTHEHAAHEPSIGLFSALRETIKSGHFIRIQVATFLMVLINCVGTLGMYVHIYLVCKGSRDLASWINGIGGTATWVASFLGLSLSMWISTRFGKKRAAMIGLSTALFSVSLLPITLRPEYPYGVVVTWFIMTLGVQCTNLMFSSMIGDICDEDELHTGLRREGTYFAVASMVTKISQVLILLLGGYLPHLIGYHSSAGSPNSSELEKMRFWLIVIQIGCFLGAFLIFSGYSLHKQEVDRIQAALALQEKRFKGKRNSF